MNIKITKKKQNNNSDIIRGYRTKLPLFDPESGLNSEKINEVIKPFMKEVNNEEIFKQEYRCVWLSSNGKDKDN